MDGRMKEIKRVKYNSGNPVMMAGRTKEIKRVEELTRYLIKRNLK